MPIPDPDLWGLAFREAYAGRLGSCILRRDDGVAEDVPEMMASYFGPPEDHQVELLRGLSGRVLDTATMTSAQLDMSPRTNVTRSRMSDGRLACEARSKITTS